MTGVPTAQDQLRTNARHASPTTPLMGPTATQPLRPPTTTTTTTECHDGCANCTGPAPDQCEACQLNYTLNGTHCDPTTSPPTTTTTTTAVSTHAPQTVPTHAPQKGDGCGRHFDAGSFFGGAALAAGIAVIIFFGCKFYKARSMPSYHQF
ncbi:hypothetical protein LSAT2_020359 [Lamellibrachia satsuma]|nr:hypothetical protein LSAT2_020359 [Lamellibrachia satsuma]